ncbi:MAG: response regulator [Gammaproteobacteria bacterium]|nr:response regulator [Gammaproteobacteria bacterium]
MRNENNQYQILVVEDYESHRKLEKIILEQEGFNVIEACNGKEALNVLQTHDIDVVLMDKNMPQLNGDDTCYKIRNELGLKLLPIIIVTGNYEKSELVKSLDSGANDFISKPFSATELIARVKSAAISKRHAYQLESMEDMLFALGRMVEAKDGNTGDHCARLAYTAEVFGKRISCSKEEIEILRRGSILHDIGKLGIPDTVLFKPEKLDAKEWGIMKTHTTIGYNICRSLKSVQDATPIILSHHERWDGSGYPQGLKGNDIPLLAQIFQLIDIYDALAYKRPYKQAFSQAKILEVFNNELALGWRNPELCREFIELIKSNPESMIMPPEYTENENATQQDFMAIEPH